MQERAPRASSPQQPVREPAHAGSAYPAEAGELRETMEQYLDGRMAPAPAPGTGRACSPSPRRTSAPRAAGNPTARPTACCGPEHRDRTFVILATSHYGEPEKFGLTRKNFATPLGEAATDQRLVDWLAERGGDAVEMEDYCHSFEHTVELQVIFLQHVLGAGRAHSADSVRPVRAQPVRRRRARRRRRRAGASSTPWASCATAKATACSGFWAWTWRTWARATRTVRGRRRTRARWPKWRRATTQRIARINAGDAAGFWDLVQRESRRSEVVRLVALLHVSESRCRRPAASCCATSSGTSTSRAW